MNLRTSRILRELRAGKHQTGFKLNPGDPRVIELSGRPVTEPRPELRNQFLNAKA
jgi:hypothetical protein